MVEPAREGAEDGEDVLGALGDPDDLHRALALRTGHDVDSEDTLQEPCPGMPRRWWLQGSVVAGLEQAQLLACFGRVLLVLRDDFRAVFGVTGEDAVVAEHAAAPRSWRSAADAL